MSNLIVIPKYPSIKEEVLSSSLSMEQYVSSQIKATKYMETLKIRRVKCLSVEQDYGFRVGDAITMQHVLAIIFYCDWIEIQSHFSSTFRAIHTFETIQSVKSRNQRYAHWSRLLREAIEVFGQDAYFSEFRNGQYIFPARGPFYSGLGSQLVLPGMEIPLNAPTSTSKSLGMAAMFTKHKGIIMQLNNESVNDHRNLKTFNCCWLSNFAEEREYLFFGSNHKIRVESIRIVKEENNYGDFCNTLFYFGCMINGLVMRDEIDITENEYAVLQTLLEGREDGKLTLPQYIYDTFRLMLNYVENITLNIYQISRYFDFGDLIINTKTMQTESLLREPFLRLFPNIETVIIESANMDIKGDKYSKHKFDILSLIEVIDESGLFIRNKLKIVITATHQYRKMSKNKELAYYDKSWIHHDQASIPMNEIKDKNLLINICEQERNISNHKLKQDWLIIAPLEPEVESIKELMNDSYNNDIIEAKYEATEYVSCKPETVSHLKQQSRTKLIKLKSGLKMIDNEISKYKREKWKIDSKLLIYSSSKSEWVEGIITKIRNDSDGEWLVVSYNGSKRRKVQRYDERIKPIEIKSSNQEPLFMNESLNILMSQVFEGHELNDQNVS